MAGALPHYKLGPASYVAGAPILGGSLVRATTSADSTAGTGTQNVPAALRGASVVQNDAAGATRLLGVALTDTGLSQYPEGSAVASSGSWAGNAPNGTDTNLDVSGLTYTVAVANNMDLKVRYESTANFGDRLYATANGGVSTTATSATLVGYCSQPGGVTGSPSSSSPVVGRAFIRV